MTLRDRDDKCQVPTVRGIVSNCARNGSISHNMVLSLLSDVGPIVAQSEGMELRYVF